MSRFSTRSVQHWRALALVAAVTITAAAPAAPVASLPQDLPDPTDTSLSHKERLEALIERVKAEQRRMETLEARFVQRRESALLVEPEESEGVFYYQAPDRVRWEYRTPNPISVVIDGEEMLTWYRDLDRADKLKVGRYSSQVFKYLGASGSMETLVDYFRVLVRFPDEPGEAYRLRLLPKYDRISEKLESMTLWIDAERYLPTRLRYVSADGETTEYRFDDMEVNGQIPGTRFSLDLPANVEIRRVELGQGAG